MMEGIKEMIKGSIERAKLRKEQFLKNERAIGMQHPKGMGAYGLERIFELKKKAKKETLIGAAWVNGHCPEIYNKRILAEIAELLKGQFNGRVQTRLPEEIRFSNLREYETDPFFETYEQIKALEECISPKKPSTQPLSLGDVFQVRYKDHIQEFVRILQEVEPSLTNTANEWIGNKGAAKVFKEELERQGVICPNISRDVIYTAFEFFPNLGKAFLKADVNYKAEGYRQELARTIALKKAEIDGK